MKRSSVGLQGLTEEDQRDDQENFSDDEVALPWENASSKAQSIHAKTSHEVAEMLGTSLAVGLSELVARSRGTTSGLNHVHSPNRNFLLYRVLWAFFGGFAPTLWLAVILSFIAETAQKTPSREGYNSVVACSLLTVVLINGAIQAWQELRADHILKSTRQLVPHQCRVKRDGVVKAVQTTHLVVGDLIELRAGGQIPTDMRVVSADNMTVDKSWLTGESRNYRATLLIDRVSADPQPGHIPFIDARCMLFAGTNVASGSGWGLAITIGPHNQIAKVLRIAATRVSKESSLRRDINTISVLVSVVGLTVATAVAFYVAFYKLKVRPEFVQWSVVLEHLVGILVSVIPLALPVVISGGLSIVANHLKSKHNVLAKKLDTVVTLGTITALLTDKTGTLTQNVLTVTSILTAPAHELRADENESPRHAVHNYRIATLCNQAVLEAHRPAAYQYSADNDIEANEALLPGVVSAKGSNSTDRCILTWANERTDSEAITAEHDILYTVSFKSASRMAMVVAQDKRTMDVFFLVKGAPEHVMPLCSEHLNKAGKSAEWQKGELQCTVDLIERKASSGLRMIALAQMGPLSAEQGVSDTIPDTGFSFVSCLALSDPLRPGTREAVQKLRSAGIKVAMMTGDSRETALHVAREAGIIDDPNKPIRTLSDFHRSLGEPAPSERDAIVVAGSEVERLSPAELTFVDQHGETILVRMVTEERVKVVRKAKEAGRIVAVTGDGINDAPAFREAHVAVAINSSPDITREVSDIVLLTDDFSAMYEAVKCGRLVFANLRKALAFMLATAFVLETVALLAHIFLGLPKPLNIVQIVILCVVHNLIGGLALMYEPAEPALMTSPPRDAERHRLLDWHLAAYSVLFYGVMLGVGAFYNYFDYLSSQGFGLNDVLFAWHWAKEMHSDSEQGHIYRKVSRGASSVFYVTLLVGQAGHLMSVRCKEPYFRRMPKSVLWRPLLGAAVSILASLPFLYIRVFNVYINTVPVPARYWGLAIGWSALWFAVAEARKWVIFLYPHSWLARMDW